MQAKRSADNGHLRPVLSAHATIRNGTPIAGRYERSWSIQVGSQTLCSRDSGQSLQDALDQHAALAEQREVSARAAHTQLCLRFTRNEVLTEIGRNRLRVRQTQLSFGELEATTELN